MRNTLRLIRHAYGIHPRSFSVCRRLGKGQQGMTTINDRDHPFYNYTSGRWLYNEDLRLAERRLYFDVDQLCRVVSNSIGRSSSDIERFAKIAEGGSYRVFEAVFRGGPRVIARLPYPCTVPRKYGIASEVATMEFLRLHGVPVPKVLDWSSVSTNEIGSEYIIMERVQGKELAETWHTMSLKIRMTIIEKIVDVERILFGLRFPASGSLFYKGFLDDGEKSVGLFGLDEKFCIGPSTEYLWWYQKRNELKANNGPWMTCEELMRAVGEREIYRLKEFGKKRYPHEPFYREFYDRKMVDPQTQIDHLLDYLKLVPYLVPDSQLLRQPTIRHPDLSPSNIFVSESGDITGIIDWQHASVLPMFLQAKIPKHFQNYGDEESEQFQRPKLAANYDAMDEGEKETEMERYRRRQVHYFYVGYTNRLNQLHFQAMGKHNLVLRTKLYDTAGRPWEGDIISLQAELIRTLELWPDFVSPGVEPPIQYSPLEIKECLERDAKQNDADEKLQHIRDFIGVNIEGWVPSDEFEHARERAKLIKKELADAADTENERKEFEEHWPFQDHEESIDG